MWFHGGWVVGNLDTYGSLCRACVASVDYRLAPEHKFPVAVNRWVAENAVSLGLDAGPAKTDLGLPGHGH